MLEEFIKDAIRTVQPILTSHFSLLTSDFWLLITQKRFIFRFDLVSHYFSHIAPFRIKHNYIKL